MAKFNEYPAKATPEDADTLMIYDAASKSNKLSPFSGIWNWIVGKLTNAVISNLQTNDKTVLGAINELNSNAKKIISKANVVSLKKLLVNRDFDINVFVLFHLSGSGYIGNDLPSNEKYKYGSGIIFYQNSSSCKIILIPEDEKPVWKMSTWEEWKDFENNIVK